MRSPSKCPINPRPLSAPRSKARIFFVAGMRPLIADRRVGRGVAARDFLDEPVELDVVLLHGVLRGPRSLYHGASNATGQPRWLLFRSRGLDHSLEASARALNGIGSATAAAGFQPRSASHSQ